MASNWANKWWSVALCAVVAVLAAGCSSAPAPSATAGLSKPLVVVQTPVNGAAVATGASLAVSGAASDQVGVDHVTLFVDGAAVATTPSGQPATLVPFNLSWLATVDGPHVLQVIAYRSDGTASDPAIVNVVVGAGGSVPIISAGSLPPPSFASPSSGGLITPKPTRRPRPSRSPRPPRPTPVAVPTPTPDASGNAPDDLDFEPYQIELLPNNKACPPPDTGGPVTASGCIWEQISAPAGDVLDELEFTQEPETSYRYGLTACSDASGAIRWSDSDEDVSSGLACMNFAGKTSSGGNPGSQPIWVGIGAVAAQTYSVYQFTVWQCRFEDCASR
jgi:hypothetical protein